MPSSLVALQIFLILLPGFSAAYVVQALATRRAQSDLERIIEALVFSFVIYVCFVPVSKGRLPFHIQHDPAGKLEDTILWDDPSQLAWVAAITAVFALGAVAYVRVDGNRVFRALKLTERTTHNSIWNDIFELEASDNQPVQVELADGRNVLGVLLYYSDESNEASLYLTQASWVGKDSELVPIPGPGILLAKGCGICSVSLLDPLPEPNTQAKGPLS